MYARVSWSVTLATGCDKYAFARAHVIGCQLREAVLSRQTRARCGARTRRGTACLRTAFPNGRCPNHGGLSTGPRTEAGKQRISQAQTARWVRWRAARGVNSSPTEIPGLPPSGPLTPPQVFVSPTVAAKVSPFRKNGAGGCPLPALPPACTNTSKARYGKGHRQRVQVGGVRLLGLASTTGAHPREEPNRNPCIRRA